MNFSKKIREVTFSLWIFKISRFIITLFRSIFEHVDWWNPIVLKRNASFAFNLYLSSFHVTFDSRFDSSIRFTQAYTFSAQFFHDCVKNVIIFSAKWWNFLKLISTYLVRIWTKKIFYFVAGNVPMSDIFEFFKQFSIRVGVERCDPSFRWCWRTWWPLAIGSSFLFSTYP